VHLKSSVYPPRVPPLPDRITIGELAQRSGVATSALRFYESAGLISSERTAGNQRRYTRATLRRVAVIRAAQRLGLPLHEIAAALDRLPDGRAPTKEDWQRLSRSWRAGVESRIADLQRLRDDLAGCIGCGCLSLRSCALFNTQDALGARGAGPRILLGEAGLSSVEALPRGSSASHQARRARHRRG
jgi:MerR family redox-sensitive transcriptional activator SoxR